MLGQFVVNLIKSYYIKTKHILRYLHGSLEYGITYKTLDEPLKFIYYIDLDWVGDVDARKFIIDYILILVKGAVCWFLKRQNTTTFLFIEIEYIVIFSAIKEIIFLSRLLDKLKFFQVKQYVISPQQLKLKSIIICNNNKGVL